MRDGRYLVTEINGVNAMSLSGSVEWSTSGVAYPGARTRSPPTGTSPRITARWRRSSYSTATARLCGCTACRPTGAAQLSRPSLALPLANGDIFATDDADRRVLVSTLGRTRSSGSTATAPLARHLVPGEPRRDGPAFAQRALVRRGALTRKYR